LLAASSRKPQKRMVTEFVRAVFALVLTLGLIGLGAVALRRYGPGAFSRFARPKAERRLAVIESLVLDPARRLVIVAVDGREQLILLGEGRLVSAIDAPKGKA
jgi:flagellar protein FliO/FliZ